MSLVILSLLAYLWCFNIEIIVSIYCYVCVNFDGEINEYFNVWLFFWYSYFRTWILFSRLHTRYWNWVWIRRFSVVSKLWAVNDADWNAIELGIASVTTVESRLAEARVVESSGTSCKISATACNTYEWYQVKSRSKRRLW